MGLVLGESVAIALLGGTVGVAITFAVTTALKDSMVQFFTGFTLPAWGIGVCFGMALVIGLGSSAIPALIAARTTICDALRHTG